jgi:DNA-binding MurR/RpiR family transcriptional regulator
VRAEQTAGAALFRVGDGAAPDHGLAPYLDQSRLDLEQTLTAIAPDTIDGLVARMIAARHLWVIGFRGGQPFARYLGWQVLQARSGVTVLPRDGETLAESIAAIAPDDLVILFALRRAPRLTRALPGELARTRAGVAVIGDLPGLSAMPAAWHLPCVTTSTGPLFNHVGVMAICGLLASRVVEQGGQAGRRRLSRIEDLHDSLGEL